MTWRVFHCQCGRPVFFRNSQCLHCGTALGYEPERAVLVPLEPLAAPADAPVDAVPAWRILGPTGDDRPFRRCANVDLAARCNWLVPLDDPGGNALCRCCRLNRIVPDQSVEANGVLWSRVELAKRRLVSSLIALRLPVASRVSEDTERGLAFDLLVADPGTAPVMTGHSDGIITLNVNEADDSTREAVRTAMQEPYRTVLGHLRHESGHYYWSRLVDGSAWHEPFRALFGDERADYGAALANHHGAGPPADWRDSFVSAYASSHPWEDWAETWAHYLHMLDTLDTSLSAGIDSGRMELVHDPFAGDVLYQGPLPGGAGAGPEFLSFLNAWIELTSVLNELSRSMGLPDFYPFVLSRTAATKLHFVHCFVQACGQASRVAEGTVAGPGDTSVAGEEDPGAALDTPASA